jgi:ABC-type transport system involved in multi-copper enzyme maturation permease subunit
MLTVTRATLKLASKSYAILFMIVLVLMIPAAVYGGLLDSLLGESAKVFGPGDYAATLLAALPIMIAFIPAIVMTKMIPSEFRERTAYLSLALPQSRPSFYFGKFLGGMIVQIFVFALAYAIVSLVTVSQKGSMDGGIVLFSFAITLVGGFAISATAFALSTFMKKGSAISIFMLFFLLFPAIMILIDSNVDGLDDFFHFAQYIPSLAGDSAANAMGSPFMIASPSSVYSTLMIALGGEVMTYNYVLNIAAYAVWGVIFLLLGLFRFIRREM